MTLSACQLVQETYVCLADNHLVFADLRDDRYRCLSRASTQIALTMFPCFQAKDAAPASEVPFVSNEAAERVLQELADHDLLARGSAAGKPFAPVEVPEPTSSLLSDMAGPLPQAHIGYWASFLCASLKASRKLRFQEFRRTVRGVERRKRRCRSPFSQDEERMRGLASIFLLLRPYYMREYLCRFDSLALVEFLAHYEQFPQWVFGVRSEPFSAHCWVQERGCVLNDSVDRVRRYTPIMAF